MNTGIKLIGAVSILSALLIFGLKPNTPQNEKSPFPEDHMEMIVKGPGKYLQAHQLIRTQDGDSNPRYQTSDRINALREAKSVVKSRSKPKFDWIERGPSNSGGRTRGLIVDPADSTSRTWFLASVGGGVWHTSDAGESWRQLTSEFSSLATSTIAMAESNQDVIYVGTGEGFPNIDAIVGTGMWKSTDRGETWTQLPATTDNDFANITRIIINPEDENEVLVSTRTVNENNTQRTYIYKTTDGGITWEEKFGRSNSTVEQLVATPGNFNILYATVNREGVMQSMDAGETWDYVWRVPDGERRIEMAMSTSDAGVIYMSCELDDGSRLYFTRDTFNTVIQPIFEERQPNWLVSQGWYDNTIAVHPYNDSIVWVAGQGPMIELKMGAEVGVIKKFSNYNSLAPFIKFVENSPFNETPAGRAPSLFDGLPVTTGFVNEDLINVELRFGDNQTSMAHLISVNVANFDFNYSGMIELPYQAWDVENNRQLTMSLFDVDGNGEWTFEDFTGQSNPFHDVVITHNLDYSDTANAEIVNNPVWKAQYYAFMGRSPGYSGPRDTLPFGFIFFNTEFEEGLISEFDLIVDGYFAYSDISNVGTKGVHVDHHNIIMIPKDSATGLFYVLNGNDGGVAFSTDSGDTFKQTGDSFNNGSFESLYGYNVSQFYGLDKMNGSNRYIGGTQDNGTWVSPVDPDSSTIWIGAPSGDGFEAAWHYDNTNLVLETSQRNNLYKSYDEGQSWRRVQLPESSGPFITRLASSQLNPDLVFMVSDTGVLRSDDFAETWEIIDMPEPWDYNASWGPPIVISLANPDVVWTGIRVNDDSRMCYSVDGGLSFTDAAPYREVTTGVVTGIATHPFDDQVAYLLFSQKNAPKILKTEDQGRSWTDISGFAPSSESTGFPDVAVYSLLVMPWDPNVLWAGTEIGIFESLDGGETWEYADNGFPAVSIWQMKIVNDEIVMATHGRGVWSLNTEIFDPTSTDDGQFDFAGKLTVAPNPMDAFSRIDYKLESSQKIKLSLLSNDGSLISIIDSGYKFEGEHSIVLERAELLPGLYFVLIEGETGSMVHKLIVQ